MHNATSQISHPRIGSKTMAFILAVFVATGVTYEAIRKPESSEYIALESMKAPVTGNPIGAAQLSEAEPGKAQIKSPTDFKLHLLTDNIPPYNMAVGEGKAFKTFSTADGITGIAGDSMKEALKRSGIPYEITLRFPLTRIHAMAKNGKGFGLFVPARTEQLENDFKWVGPIAETSMVLFARPGSNLVLKDLEDARGLVIGGLTGSAVAGTLNAHNFALKETSVDANNIKKLLDGTIDVWATTREVGSNLAKTFGSGALPVALTFQDAEVYLALNVETPDSVVVALQRSFDSIREDGTLAEISRKYL